MADRETLLTCLIVLIILWVGIIDFGPLVGKWIREKGALPIVILSPNQGGGTSRAMRPVGTDEPFIYKDIHQITVRNISKTTLRSLMVIACNNWHESYFSHDGGNIKVVDLPRGVLMKVDIGSLIKSETMMDYVIESAVPKILYESSKASIDVPEFVFEFYPRTWMHVALVGSDKDQTPRDSGAVEVNPDQFNEPYFRIEAEGMETIFFDIDVSHDPVFGARVQVKNVRRISQKEKVMLYSSAIRTL